MKIFPTLTLALCIGASLAGAAPGPVDSRTIAVVDIGPSGARTHGRSPDPLVIAFDTLLEARLAELGSPAGGMGVNVHLVDRQHLDKIVAELALSQTALADPAGRLKIAKLANADIVVWTWQTTAKDKSPWLVVRAAESLTGVIVETSAVQLVPESIEAGAAETARNILDVLRHAGSTRPTVAVGIFESKSRFERLRPLESGLQELVSNSLLRQSEFRVVERTQLKALIQEQELIETGLTDEKNLPNPLPSRQAGYFLRGTFNDAGDGSESRVAVHCELLQSPSGALVWSKDFESSTLKINVLAESIAGEVRRSIGKPEAPALPAAKEGAEADVLMAQARMDLAPIARASMISWQLQLPELAWWTSVQPNNPACGPLARKAATRLECVLFMRPTDVEAKVLLAVCRSVRTKEAWEPSEAERLYKEAAAADPNGRFGRFARRSLPRLYLDVSFREHDPRYLELCAQAYADLENDPDNPERPAMWLTTNWEASRWFAELKHYDRTLEMLRRNINKAPRLDLVTQRHEFFPLQYTTEGLVALAAADATKTPEAIKLLRVWQADPSGYLHYDAAMALGRISAKTGDFTTAAAMFEDAAKVCEGQKDNWFPPRQGDAVASWLPMKAKVDGPEAALAAAGPYLPRLDAYSSTSGGLVRSVGDLYESTGQVEKALALYKHYKETQGGWDQPILARIKRLSAAHPQTNPHPLDVQVFAPKTFITQACVCNKTLWAVGNWRLWRIDIEGKTAREFKLAFPHAESMAATGTHLWIAPGAGGLWRLDTTKDPAAADSWTHWDIHNGLPDDRVTFVCADGNEVLLAVGTESSGGLIRLDAHGQFHTFTEAGAPTITPNSIVPTTDAIWTGALSGIDRFDRKTSTWSHILSQGAHVSLGQNRIIAHGGFSVSEIALDPATGKFRDKVIFAPKFPHRVGNTVVVESADQLWISGVNFDSSNTPCLVQFTPATGAAIDFSENPALTFNRVYAGVEFHDTLWLCTNIGLVAIREAH